MISAVLLLQIALAVPGPASPQSVVVKRTGKETRVPVVATQQGPMLRADALAAALDGSIARRLRGRSVLSAAGATLEFADGIPFVRSDSITAPLVAPPVYRDGALFIPLQVATDILPRVAVGLLFDATVAELRVFNRNARPGTSVSDLGDITPVGATERPPAAVTSPATGRAPRRVQHRLIVVDAGHGGVDNGMSGPLRGGPQIHEKNITLAVAKLLARELRSNGMDVLMTRSTDTLIALSDRGRIANRARGDLFVSIHVNATGYPKASWGPEERGFETYFLAEAKTEEEGRVERMENESVKFETGANAPKGDPLSFIIADMAQNEHLRESNDLAETIQEGLKTIHPGPSRGVKQANFAVLRGSFMPAVLVEIGFGTNRDEAAWLSDASAERTIAANVAQSVLSYLEHYDSRVGGGGN